MTLVPRSSKATVVPTGMFWLASPICISAKAANFLPLSTKVPSRLSKVPDGSLNGSGTKASLKLPPGASISLNSPGCKGWSSFLIRIPLALNPAGKLDNVPASINCRKIDVDAFDNPPIM